MLTTAQLGIRMVQGDNTPLNLTFRDYSTKDLEDLSDKTLEAFLKLSSGTEIELDVATGSDLENGLVVVTIPSGDLADVTPGLHTWWLKATEGGVTQTLIQGAFQVVEAG